MKVCVLTTSFPAHPEDIQSPFIYRFVKGIVSNAVDATVVCPHYKTSTAHTEERDGMHIHRFRYFPKRYQTFTEVGSIPDAIKTWKGKFQLPFFCLAYLYSALRIGRTADLIHAQWIIPSAFIGIFLKKIYKKPLVATTRGAELVLASKSSFYRPLLKYTIRQCDYITSNNVEHVQLLKNLGADHNKIRCIPNGLDYDLYKQGSKDEARQHLHLPLNVRIILVVGYLIERKRVSNIIHALHKLPEKYKDALLLIVGDGPLRDSLTALVYELHLESRVLFAGKIPPERVPPYMNAADLFVLASASEGRPNVVIEAMASHLPIITTNIGDVTSFIEDGKNGFIIPVDDIDAITDKIGYLFDHPETCARFITNGYAAVRKSNPTWHESGQHYLAIYQSLLTVN